LQQSVDDQPCLEQIGNARDTRCSVGIASAAGSRVRPGDRNEPSASVGADDEQLTLTVAVGATQDLKRPSFERMGCASDGDGGGNVFEMGSVSCFLSMTSIGITFGTFWTNGCVTA
jgi:hypothetical protein